MRASRSSAHCSCDTRPGARTVQFGLEASDKSNTLSGYEYRLGFIETEGSSQCGGNRNSYTAWVSGSGLTTSSTAPFRDDTDE